MIFYQIARQPKINVTNYERLKNSYWMISHCASLNINLLKSNVKEPRDCKAKILKLFRIIVVIFTFNLYFVKWATITCFSFNWSKLSLISILKVCNWSRSFKLKVLKYIIKALFIHPRSLHMLSNWSGSGQEQKK